MAVVTQSGLFLASGTPTGVVAVSTSASTVGMGSGPVATVSANAATRTTGDARRNGGVIGLLAIGVALVL